MNHWVIKALLSLSASGQIIFCKPQFADFVGKTGIYRLLIGFMNPPGAAAWHPERFCFIAAAPSASTGVTARDKVDRLEARTAFRAAEPHVLREAVAGAGAPQAAGAGASRGAVDGGEW